uniref:Sodium/hydrogen exchanger n=1 Tax=Guillardia theta TaxID=55529 RepID=A0A7S4L0P4_GUITH
MTAAAMAGWLAMGEGGGRSAEEISLEEKAQSWNLVVVVTLLGVCIFCTYLLLATSSWRCIKYLPESVVTIVLGILAGSILTLSGQTLSNLITFDPQTFFIYMLPPIIFESGYSLHKGNFFINFGSILVFAVAGTLISTLVVGLGTYVLGQMKVSYPLTMLDSLTFGSLISATDPVATLAIFHALDVNPTLYMLVFGESVLNDAVAVVLFRTFLSFYEREHDSWTSAILQFVFVSLFSGVVGVIVALFSALVFKLTRLYQHPSLEAALMFVFAYLPYMLTEALNLSGIMAILFAGIVMSHYTHYNLSPTTQMTAQQTFRTAALMAETAIFAYMGLSLPTLQHRFHVGFIISAMVLILLGRALNIFPLSFLINRKSQNSGMKISSKEQFIMWFSGLRGAIAFSLVLNMQSHSLTAVSPETKAVLVTTTLIVVLSTIFIFGGGTAPLLEMLLGEKKEIHIAVSKTSEMGAPLDLRESMDDWRYNESGTGNLSVASRRAAGFELYDKQWFIPIFRVLEHERPVEAPHGFHLPSSSHPHEREMLLREENEDGWTMRSDKGNSNSNTRARSKSPRERTNNASAASS